MMTNFRLSGESGEAMRIEGAARERGTRKRRFFDVSDPDSGKEPDEDDDEDDDEGDRGKEEGDGKENWFVCDAEEC